MYLNLENEQQKLFIIKPRKSKSISSFTLRLTPMIDMFTILLVFLLKSFSVEGEIMSVAKDLQLPESVASTPPKASPILVVTNEWIILDGNPVVRVGEVMESPQNEIPALRQLLRQGRAFTQDLGQLDARRQFRGEITIQGNKEIPFRLLKKIMYSCGQEGFNNMLLAVNQKEHS